MSDVGADALVPQMIGDAGAKPKRGGLMQVLVPVAVLTVVAIAGGAGVGYLIGGKNAEQMEATAKAAEHAPAEAADAAASAKADPENPTTLVKLQPVITNIANPPKAVVRLEASIVFRAKDVEDGNVLAAQVAGDTLAFLRTIDLVQIEGARGLLHLKEDLTERAKLRSPAITDYLVESLVAQ